MHDLAEVPTSTMPQPYSDGFFNRPWVQDALGARVNFTANSNVVYNGEIYRKKEEFPRDSY